MLNYLLDNKEYTVGEEIECEEILNDNILYDLMKETWVANMFLPCQDYVNNLRKSNKR